MSFRHSVETFGGAKMPPPPCEIGLKAMLPCKWSIDIFSFAWTHGIFSYKNGGEGLSHDHSVVNKE